MKNSTLKLSYIFLITLVSYTAYGQKADSSQSISKKRDFALLGQKWTVINYTDGTKTVEWEEKRDRKLNVEKPKKDSRFTYEFLDSEIGIGTYTSQQGAPEVKPWGSWYVSLHSVGIWKAGKNLHVRTTLGVNWYNFKFENPGTVAVSQADGVNFMDFQQLPNAPTGTPMKSKISASYATLSILPTLRSSNGNFRLGAGAYAGYRLGGRGKFVYSDENGDKQKRFEKSSLYLENFRYGLRTEIGVASVTLFYNFDLTNLFQTSRGPELHAMSFGLRIN